MNKSKKCRNYLPSSSSLAYGCLNGFYINCELCESFSPITLVDKIRSLLGISKKQHIISYNDMMDKRRTIREGEIRD